MLLVGFGKLNTLQAVNLDPLQFIHFAVLGASLRSIIERLNADAGGEASSIAEMLTIELAASSDPGERHTNTLESSEACDHFAGTVQDIPCLSQLTV